MIVIVFYTKFRLVHVVAVLRSYFALVTNDFESFKVSRKLLQIFNVLSIDIKRLLFDFEDVMTLAKASDSISRDLTRERIDEIDELQNVICNTSNHFDLRRHAHVVEALDILQ